MKIQPVLQLLPPVGAWLKSCSDWVRWVFTVIGIWRSFPSAPGLGTAEGKEHESWQTDAALRVYGCCGETMVTVYTSTYAFHVDLEKLSDSSEYFRGLSQSSMRETMERLVHLDHVPAMVFYNFLEFTFRQRFQVAQEDLGAHIQVGSYLQARPFISRCLSALTDCLSPENCRSYLDLAQEICCTEMRDTVYQYLSRRLLELPHLTRSLGAGVEADLIRLRSKGSRQLCALRKENLLSGSAEEDALRRLYSLVGSDEDGDWREVTALPFTADKWSFTVAVLYNYLYLIGGYRHRAKKGYQFKMASFRYNPFTHTWVPTAPLIKHRRHFSSAVCDGSIFAVGGWYLDSLVAPDSSTSLYTAVERYDPWADSWAFVASLPLNDFSFTMSLSHDVPLTAALGRYVYVVGTIQRTGEMLVLQYDTRRDSWAELLPTLTRADVNIPSLYFLGTTDRLHVIGGNNSENVVTSFCVESQRWGAARSLEKVALVGQGSVLGSDAYIPAVERNSIMRLNLRSLSAHSLPPLPVSTSYEALFHLYF
ncbi:kelch-like protein 20 isoform X2 [Brienomyrus brachyistius]|nr:kelch-like protein 20 isoform X2 [Brienomyrus brachyistius]